MIKNPYISVKLRELLDKVVGHDNSFRLIEFSHNNELDKLYLLLGIYNEILIYNMKHQFYLNVMQQIIYLLNTFNINHYGNYM